MDAIVIAAEVAPGTGILANEPITTATLREVGGDNHRDHVVRIVGGPSGRGGWVYVAGRVVPYVGARVRLDLAAPPLVSSTPLTASTTAWIANTPSGVWDTASLPVSFVPTMPRSRDLGLDAIAELDVAARTWGRPSCTSFRAKAAAEQSNLAPGDDGINGIFFHDTSWPSELVAGALGQTIVHVDSNGKLHDTDIHINGADFRYSKDGGLPGSSSPNALPTQDLRSVLVHEIGHALGLGHSNDARATMNTSGSGLRWRSLEKDDVDGVCALYPGAGTGSVGCDGPCPSDFVCVANECQRNGEAANVCSPCSLDSLTACEGAGDEARCVAGVCGRACAQDSDCGAGFSCRPTTEAGDLQCISLTNCKNGANTCVSDAECKQSPSTCSDGACVGPLPPTPIADAGVDAGAVDSGTNGSNAPIARGGDCDCRSSSASSAARLKTPMRSAWLLLAGLLVLGARRRSRLTRGNP